MKTARIPMYLLWVSRLFVYLWVTGDDHNFLTFLSQQKKWSRITIFSLAVPIIHNYFSIMHQWFLSLQETEKSFSAKECAQGRVRKWCGFFLWMKLDEGILGVTLIDVATKDQAQQLIRVSCPSSYFLRGRHKKANCLLFMNHREFSWNGKSAHRNLENS